MLDIVAPIYRRLIYEFLDIYSIHNLALVNKQFYQDQERRTQLIQKISLLFGYQNKYLDVLHFDFSIVPQYLKPMLVNSYVEKTIVEPVNKAINHPNGHLFYDDDLFANLSQLQKQMIVDTYFRFFESYAKQPKVVPNLYFHSMCIYQIHYMFYSIQDLEFRNYLIQKLLDYNQTYLAESSHTKPKDYKLMTEIFMREIVPGNKIEDLDSIMEIAFYLKTQNPKYLSMFLDGTFGSYLDDELFVNLRVYNLAVELEKSLEQSNVIYPERTNEDVLEQLLFECKLFSVKLVKEAIKQRKDLYLKSRIYNSET